MGLEVEQVSFVTDIVIGGGDSSVEEISPSPSLDQSDRTADVELVEVDCVIT